MTNNAGTKTCAICSANIAEASDVLYDEHTDNYFCDTGCFEEWADHTQKPLEYYARHNVSRVVRR